MNTLELGKHSFEAWFWVPESGNARASFMIVEDEANSDEEEYPSAPNSGLFTNGSENAVVVNGIVPFAVIVGFIAAIKTVIRIAKRN